MKKAKPTFKKLEVRNVGFTVVIIVIIYETFGDTTNDCIIHPKYSLRIKVDIEMKKKREKEDGDDIMLNCLCQNKTSTATKSTNNQTLFDENRKKKNI